MNNLMLIGLLEICLGLYIFCLGFNEPKMKVYHTVISKGYMTTEDGRVIKNK